MTYNGTVHAFERAQERFALELTEEDMRGCVMEIIDAVDRRGGKALLLHLQPKQQCEIWLVRLGGREVRVVYNPELARIVTVLPPGHKLMSHW